MQIGIGRQTYRDSFKFNAASLEKMIDARRKPYDNWKEGGCKGAEPVLAEIFPRMATHPFLKGETGSHLQEGLELLLRKVPFPYTSMTDASYWTLPAVLPKEAYDSELGGKCTVEDYEMVKTVCQYFDINNQTD